MKKCNFAISFFVWCSQMLAPFDAYMMPVPYFSVILVNRPEFYPLLSAVAFAIGLIILSIYSKSIIRNICFHILTFSHLSIVLYVCSESGYSTRFLSKKNFYSLIFFLITYIIILGIFFFNLLFKRLRVN